VRGGLGAAYQAVVNPLHDVLEVAVSPVSLALGFFGVHARAEDRPRVVADDLAEANRRIERLLADNLRLEMRVEDLRRKNAALQDLREHFDRGDYTFRQATVMGRALDRDSRTMVINRGRAHDVAVDHIVVDGPYLVGRVTDTTRVTADVRLVNAPGMRLDAILLPEDWGGGPVPAERRRQAVQFQPEGADRFAAQLHQRVAAEVGDVAHLRDDFWPPAAQGLVLGRVTAIEPVDDPPLRKRITIEPMVNLNYLTEVTVILPQGAGD